MQVADARPEPAQQRGDVLAAQPSVEWNVVEFDACATDVMEAVADSLTWLVNHGLAGLPGAADPLGPVAPNGG